MSKSEATLLEPMILLLLTVSRGAESRKKILTALLSGPKNCNQLAKDLDLDWWTIQKHIRVLVKEKLIVGLDFGRVKFYNLTKKEEEVIKYIQSKANDSNEIKKDVVISALYRAEAIAT